MKKKTLLGIILILTVVSLACRLGSRKRPATAPTQPPAAPPETSETAPTVHASETYQVAITRGVAYGQGLSHTDWGSETNQTMPLLLDVYEPVDAPGNRPAMVLIHGGGLRTGSRMHNPITNLAEYFAARGWVTVSIDYRLIDDHGTLPEIWMEKVSARRVNEDTADQLMALYPAARDAKATVRWLYANADAYQINTDYITVGGGSAGAYLSVSLGVTEDEDFRDELSVEQDPTLASTHLEQPARVHTILDFWGGGGHIAAYEAVYGVNHFDASDAPILIAHGDKDNVVDFENAETLRSTYTETGVPYIFYRLNGEPHSAWSAQVNGKGLDELSFDFIVEQQGLRVME